MKKLHVSSTRRLVLWFYDEPSCDPYVSLNFDVDVGPLRTFLDAFEREHGERIGVQHVMTKAVARCLEQLPALNVKVLGRTLYGLDRIDIAMPVHLAAGASGGDETGMTIVHHVDRCSLLEVARATRKGARDEREGRMTAGGSSVARAVARWVPDRVLRTALDSATKALASPTAYRLLESQFGVSSGVTNVGAVFALPKGVHFRGASATVPHKLGHIASLFGVAPTEEIAAIEDGAVVARRVLPILMVVDHRAIDGVLMATAAARVAESLLDPSRLVAGR